MQHHIALEWNLFGEKHVSMLLAGTQDHSLHDYMERHYDDIVQKLSARGVDLLYPQILKETDDTGIGRLFDYHFPSIDADPATFDSLKRTVSDTALYADLFGLAPSALPCLVFVFRDAKEERSIAKAYPLTDTRSFDEAVDSIIRESGNIRLRVQFSIGRRDPAETSSDREFEQDSHLLSTRLKAEIESELTKNRGVGALRMLLFMFQGMRDRGIRLNGGFENLISDLHGMPLDRPSRLLVSINGPLKLIDYSKQIALTPLQKTVFIFFLNHEKGVQFKDLPMHRNELLSIYRVLSNKSSNEEIERSVDGLSNPLENSMSEKCARIKEAFIRAMDDRLAQLYYIRGERNEPKRIWIDRGLVEFDKHQFKGLINFSS